MSNNISFGDNHQGASKKDKSNVQEDSKPEIKLTPMSKIIKGVENNLEELKKHYQVKSQKELYDIIILFERVENKLQDL